MHSRKHFLEWKLGSKVKSFPHFFSRSYMLGKNFLFPGFLILCGPFSRYFCIPLKQLSDARDPSFQKESNCFTGICLFLASLPEPATLACRRSLTLALSDISRLFWQLAFCHCQGRRLLLATGTKRQFIINSSRWLRQ